MPKITVITPTARYGGVDIWVDSLLRQTFTDFEAIMVDQLHRIRGKMIFETLGNLDSRFRYLAAPDPVEGKFWALSRSLNYGLSKASGELIVFLQDYIYMKEDALEKFWARYQENPEGLVSGVGHKYASPSWCARPFGLFTVFDSLLGSPTPSGLPWEKDPRIKGNGFHLCNPAEWEGNFASCPKVVAEDLGGFDEDFDAGWGFDNVNFAERAMYSGRPIFLDEDNQCLGFAHELLFSEVKKKAKAPRNLDLWRQKLDSLQKGGAWRVNCLPVKCGWGGP